MVDSSVQATVAQLVAETALRLAQHNHRLTTAESCTGGLLAAALTAQPGSSRWFEYGFVSYSNRAKSDLLGVSSALIKNEGAVSEACVRAMAEGARARAGADWALAVSGIAGPDGESLAKPLGTVWIAWCGPDSRADSRLFQFAGDRESVRQQAAKASLEGLLRLL